MNKVMFEKYSMLIKNYAENNYKKMFREPDGILKHKFIVPGSSYSNSLWDWDSWLTNIALRKINREDDISEYEKGCVLNFLDHIDDEGRIPISIIPTETRPNFKFEKDTNVHKPCLAQHALFVSEQINDYEWLRGSFCKIEKYIDFYIKNCKHNTGLFYWVDDCAIGVDNDPCTFYRPKKSSASIFLNCLMYMEFLSMTVLAEKFDMMDMSIKYSLYAEELKTSVQEYCWDERNGFYYNVDINLLPIDKNNILHSGCPRHWECLIQRIDVWSGFLAMWSGIATMEQAERIVKENYLNEKTFNAPYGVRTLSKLEKMYAVIKSGNPSCWLGPIWGISNYMTFDGLRKYGFYKEALMLSEKTINLFGRDIEENGDLHEYYNPETGIGVNNKGFQNWNLLSLDMIEWVEKSYINEGLV